MLQQPKLTSPKIPGVFRIELAGQDRNQQWVHLLQDIHHFHPTDPTRDAQEKGETRSPWGLAKKWESE